MAVIRDHFTQMGLGLHNDLQNEHSIVGNFPFVNMFEHFGTAEQQEEFILGGFERRRRVAFGLTEPDHGSDATHMETVAVRETRDGVAGWRIDGRKMWITGMHVATHCAAFCRTSGKAGDAKGITCLLVPIETPGMVVDEYLWTFNMPTDHPRMHFENCWVPESAVLGPVDGGLSIAQSFVHQNRIRQAASSLGAATFCVEESVKYARERKPFGAELARNQGIQFPLVELATQCEMLRSMIYKTAWEMDNMDHKELEHQLSDKISMCNYYANRLVCEAADRPCRSTAGSVIRGISRLSISIATTAAIGSLKALKKSRCAKLAPICSAILGRARRSTRSSQGLCDLESAQRQIVKPNLIAPRRQPEREERGGAAFANCDQCLELAFGAGQRHGFNRAAACRRAGD
jgi:acyl-CoA dehydrogenase